MFQLVTVLVSFAAVPLLGKLKVGLGPSLIATAVIMALLNRLGIMDIASIFAGVFTTKSSLNTLLVVAVVSVIGTMMKEYGILDKVIEALSELIQDKRILMILVPALIGTLSMPGGAILSAPFALSLGEELGMDKPKRAASNLIFRHTAMFVLPYSNSLLVASSLTGFTPGNLISANIFFALPLILAGYFIYLRKIPVSKEKQERNRSVFASLKQVLVYASPIYICIILHLITGVPLYICMLGSLIIIYMLGPKTDFFPLLFKSIGYKTVISVVGVFMIQGVVTNLDGLIGLFQQMFASGGFMLPALLVTSLFFGLITGFHIAPLSIVLPMLLTLGLGPGQLLAYIYFVYCWAFLGYYFSPLHMCQIFTCEFMGVKIKDLYKEYLPLMAFVAVYLIASYFALNQILPLIYG